MTKVKFAIALHRADAFHGSVGLEEEESDEKRAPRRLLKYPGFPKLPGRRERVERQRLVIARISLGSGIVKDNMRYQREGGRLELRRDGLGGGARADVGVEEPEDLVDQKGMRPGQYVTR